MEVGNNLNFTAFLYKQSWNGAIKMPCTIQRVQLGNDTHISLSALKEKLTMAFQELKSSMVEFKIYWGNAESDWMSIKDDAGLTNALKGMKGAPYQLHITVKPKLIPQRIFNSIRSM